MRCEEGGVTDLDVNRAFLQVRVFGVRKRTVLSWVREVFIKAKGRAARLTFCKNGTWWGAVLQLLALVKSELTASLEVSERAMGEGVGIGAAGELRNCGTGRFSAIINRIWLKNP